MTIKVFGKTRTLNRIGAAVMAALIGAMVLMAPAAIDGSDNFQTVVVEQYR
jgi:hypothetical protein